MEINILLLLLVLSSFLHETHGYEIIRIKDVSEFISFMESAASFSGTTVYLDSDMDFSDSPAEYLKPKSSFYGTFDGQGYAIRNLGINSTSSNTGMFMYSTGGTIRNVVMEPSCSITSYFSGNDNLHVGGIIGYYQSQNDQNIIENIVNMGTISFEGNAVE